MRSNSYPVMDMRLVLILLATMAFGEYGTLTAAEKPRVIVTSDGEIDDECSMVRFLLYANEFEVEGIVTSSSQYHWQGHRWACDDWVQPNLDAYAQGYANLVKHDPAYPTPEYLRSRTALGNVIRKEIWMKRRRARSLSSRYCWTTAMIDRFGCKRGAGPTPSRGR